MSTSRAPHPVRHPEQRAVAPEHDDEIDERGQVVAADDAHASDGADERRGVAIDDGRQLAAGQPLDHADQVRRRRGEPALGDEADGRDHAGDSVPGLDAPAGGPARRWNRYSWLPVAPVIGDGVMPCGANPIAAAAADTSAITRSCTARSRTSPPRPTSLAPGLELRLHERDDVGVGAQERGHDRQHQAQRDERHVDGDDVHRSGQVGWHAGCARSCPR